MRAKGRFVVLYVQLAYDQGTCCKINSNIGQLSIVSALQLAESVALVVDVVIHFLVLKPFFVIVLLPAHWSNYFLVKKRLTFSNLLCSILLFVQLCNHMQAGRPTRSKHTTPLITSSSRQATNSSSSSCSKPSDSVITCSDARPWRPPRSSTTWSRAQTKSTD